MPLNIWLCPGGPSPGATARYQLAERVVREYIPEGGTVIDLAPGGGEVGRAATAARRSVVAVPNALPCTAGPARPPRRVADLVASCAPADLAVLLPPAERLDPPYRRFAIPLPTQRLLLAALASVVKPGGYVALACLGDPHASVTAPEAATGAGLVYFQHVVGLLVPEERPALRAHVDVLVFERRTA